MARVAVWAAPRGRAELREAQRLRAEKERQVNESRWRRLLQAANDSVVATAQQKQALARKIEAWKERACPDSAP